MLSGIVEEREGVLLRKLKDAGHGGRTTGYGFITGAGNGAKSRAMLIVARIPTSKKLSSEIQSLSSAGADAVEITVKSGDDIAAVASAVAEVEVPCGIFLDGAVDDTDTSAFDWVHVATDAQAHLLAGDGPTRVVSLPPDMPPGRLSGLAGLKADIVTVDGLGAELSLTVDTLLAVRAIETATKGPVLASSGLGITPRDVPVLRDSGIDGVLLSGNTATIKDFVKAIEALSD